nr:Ypt/Rab-GAP domain of gyp1p superfamily protein [Tanacetum cinerariifolium]
MDSAEWEDVVSARESLSSEEINSSPGFSDNPIIGSLLLEDAGGSTRFMDPNISDSESTDSDFSQEAE